METIDYEKIIKEKWNQFEPDAKFFIVPDWVEFAMKEAVRQAIPIILKHAAENAYTDIRFVGFDSTRVVDKKSILSQQQDIEKLLELI